MFALSLIVILAIAKISTVNSECPNGCSGHGTCNAYDLCTCDAQFQGNDCSERTCAFGRAHSDISKGDIDGDGWVSNANKIVGVNGIVYRYGTTEGFPPMRDSDQTVLTNTAHEYAECSAKGHCDRTTGTCNCYPAYDGVACQRASCPGYPASCSGHGVCKTIKQLAAADFGNVYELWDEDATMGCECDSGYYGADCSLRKCKVGQDPLYEDDVGQRKTTQYIVGILQDRNTSRAFNDGTTQLKKGSYRYIFTDAYGKRWETATLYDKSTCAQVVAAFQGLPSDVLPANSVRCFHLHMGTPMDVRRIGISPREEFQDAYNGERITVDLSSFYQFGYGEPLFEQNVGSETNTSEYFMKGDIYAIRFPTLPRLPPIEIETHLDGARPTLMTNVTTYETFDDAKIVIYSDGQIGETNDWFGDYCVNVKVKISHRKDNGIFLETESGSDAEANRLKACLGDADGDLTNNIGLQNWDKGNQIFPHLVKITKVAKNSDDDSDYLALYFEENNDNGKEFKLLNPYVPRDKNRTALDNHEEMDDNDVGTNNLYNIFTTRGVMKLVSNSAYVIASPGFNKIYTVNETKWHGGKDTSMTAAAGSAQANFGDISCENSYGSSLLTNNKKSMTSESSGVTQKTCVEKDDWILLLGSNKTAYDNTGNAKMTISFLNNPAYINIYNVKEIGTRDAYMSMAERIWGNTKNKEFYRYQNISSPYMRNQLTLDHSPNFLARGTPSQADGTQDNVKFFAQDEINVYKFFPAASSTYKVMSECSGRGSCNTDTGICECFPGYTGDACSVQAVTSC